MPLIEELQRAIWDKDKREAEFIWDGGKYVMRSRPFHSTLPKTLGGLKYEAEGKYISFAPVGVNTVNAVLSDTKHVRYENAWPDCSIEVEVSKTHWKKLVKFNKPPKTRDKFVELVFEVETDFKIQEHSHYKAQIGNSYIEQAQAWDSTPREQGIDENEEPYDTENKIAVESEFYEDHGTTYFVKRIPAEWLAKAVYPVWTDTDISWGTASEFEDGDIMSGYATTSCCAIDDNKFVVAYMDDADGDAGKARVGTVSGTTITWGDISEFCSDIGIGKTASVCKLDTDKFVVAYADDSQSDDGYARVGTVSTRTISWGTAKEFWTGDTEAAKCCPLDTDKFAIVFNDETGGDYLKVMACTVSGTTITTGDAVSLGGGSYSGVREDSCQLDTDKLVVVFRDYDATNVGKAVACTISGTTITVGDAITFEAGVASFLSVCALDTSKFVVTWSDYYSYDNHQRIKACTVSGTTITQGDEYDLNGGGVTSYPSLATVDSTHCVCVYRDTDNSNKGTSVYITVTGTDVSLGDEEIFNDADTTDTSACVLADPAVVVCAYCDDADATDHGEAIAGTLPSAGGDEYEEDADLGLGVALAADRALAIQRSSSLGVGAALTATRLVAYQRSSDMGVGLALAASKIWGHVRSAALGLGVALAADRAVTYGRSSDLGIGTALSATRQAAYQRTSDMGVGVALAASRLVTYLRSSDLGVGVSLAASKLFGKVCSAALGVGVALAASRQVAYQRSSALGLGIALTASRLVAYLRSAALGIGAALAALAEVTHKEIQHYYETAALGIGVALSATRQVAYNRASSLGVGVALEATRQLVIQRTSALATGVALTASKVFGKVCSASLGVGVALTASKAVAFKRTGELGVGLALTASRLLVLGRTSALGVGVALTAKRIHARCESAALGVGVALTAFRQVAYKRTSAVAVGLALTASRLVAYGRSASLGMGVALTATLETFWKIVIVGVVKHLYTIVAKVKHLYDVRPTKRSGF